jgi:hypothetical protein
METQALFGPGNFHLDTGDVTQFAGINTDDVTWTIGDWQFGTTTGSGYTWWNAFQEVQIDISGWTGLEKMKTLAPLGASITRSPNYTCQFTAAAANDPDTWLREFVFCTTQQIEDQVDAFLAPQAGGDYNGPLMMGHKGGWIDPQKVIYGKWWAQSENKNLAGGDLSGKIYTPFDGGEFGSGDLLGTDKLYWYRWFNFWSNIRLDTDDYHLLIPAVTAKMTLGFADVDKLSHIMALKRNVF